MNKYRLTYLHNGEQKDIYASNTRIAINRLLDWFPIKEVVAGHEARLELSVANLGPAVRIARYEWRTDWYDSSRERCYIAQDDYQLKTDPMPDGWELYSRKKIYQFRRAREVVPCLT